MLEATSTGTAAAATDASTSTETVATTLLGADATTTTTAPTEQSATTQITTETTTEKPATTQTETPESKAAVTEAKPAPGAPEAYAFKAPEGTEYDTNILTAFEAGARDANLSQEAAQKLLDTMTPKIATRQAEQVAAVRQGWFDASKADKEFGGAALEQNLGVAKRALDDFGTPELNQLLTSTGLGNHPEIIRFMYKAGKAISQDKMVTGSAPGRPKQVATSVLYDNTK
jgi:hypothetical protein